VSSDQMADGGGEDGDIMEVDGGEQGPPSEPLVLNVLQTVKSAQLQHGLRHEDYDRYRCSSRWSMYLQQDLMIVCSMIICVFYLLTCADAGCRIVLILTVV
jgi:hypothetical protein